MGTEDLFELLVKRAKEAAARIIALEEENKSLKVRNSELVTQKERAREKVRELLDKLCLSDE